MRTALLAFILTLAIGGTPMSFADSARQTLDRLLSPPPRDAAAAAARLELLRQDYEQLERNLSILKTPLTIGSRRFDHGVGTHAVSHLRVFAPEPVARFSAWVGVDRNDRTTGGQGSVVFSVALAGREVYHSPILRGGDEPEHLDLDVAGATVLDLHVGDAGDGPACDHADWADATLTLRSGKTLRLDELPVTSPTRAPRYPFSFQFGGTPSDDLLDKWTTDRRVEKLDADRTRVTTTFTDPASGLRVQWDVIQYADFPAVEWLLHFENTGKAAGPQGRPADTPIMENVQALDVAFNGGSFLLHRTKGAPADPTDFENAVVPISPDRPQTLVAAGGRSSNRDLPFFKIETGAGAFVVAVGWTGQWSAKLECPDPRSLHATAGMEQTHFLLHPGERVRSPRMLILGVDGDPWEANALFRQLVYKHYCPPRSGAKLLPTLFCNTCFTRGGGWLNECNAENQISLIKAYAPLGLEALLTDAGWFEGGWPSGAGNWTPRHDAYPQGMGPVAAAARDAGMVYGLWFEPERVVAGTAVHRAHPDWCLGSQDQPEGTYLLNFGLPAVQDYFFGIVKGFMDLPGFRVYRQDFNMDPLAYWRHADAPDRQGITEMKYVEGLYAYWDHLASAWPDSFREGCASGGRRIDLETVMRFHCSQKTDYWFDPDVDQASVWALSQYLPNNAFVAHLATLDDYRFYSAMPSSLCLGWITDDPKFDFATAHKLADRYREVRHLLIGAWYPLLPQTRDRASWLASQYHRPDLGEGMILIFRRSESRYRQAEFMLHGLKPAATYKLTRESTGEKVRMTGSELMSGYLVTMPAPSTADMIRYREAG